MKIRLILLFSMVTVLGGNSMNCYAKEGIDRYSGLYLTPSEIPAPELEFIAPDGISYELRNSELEEFNVPKQTEQVESLIVYDAVGKSDSLPETAEIRVQDEESEGERYVRFPLLHTEYTNGRWKEFLFQMTVHEYDADLYLLNGRSMRAGDTMTELFERKEDVLEILGLSQNECRNLKFEWEGEPYEDESGILCRQISAAGERKVWDCSARYGGEIAVPGYNQYRMKYSYGKKEELTDAEGENILECEEQEADGDLEDTLKSKLMRALKICLEVTVGILFLLLAIAGFRFLRSFGRKIKKEE